MAGIQRSKPVKVPIFIGAFFISLAFFKKLAKKILYSFFRCDRLLLVAKNDDKIREKKTRFDKKLLDSQTTNVIRYKAFDKNAL
ncbi:hypothetical protein B5G50_21530 [Brevibacillus brevis]|nr:hypothetical protein B5G50_21530 [Brevibacillus brevis]